MKDAMCIALIMPQRRLALFPIVILVGATWGASPAGASHNSGPSPAPDILDLDEATAGGADVLDPNGASSAPWDWATLFGCVNAAPPANASAICTPVAPTQGSTGYESLIASAFIKDHTGNGDGTADASNFIGGGSKDINDIPSWRCTSSTDNDGKFDLYNAYAAFFEDAAGNQVLFVGSERGNQAGTAFAGFWLLQGAAPCVNGTFVGTHSVNDIFLVGDFTGGGGTTNFMQLYRWDGTQPVLIFGGARCSALNATALDPSCGEVNTIARATPWSPRTGNVTTAGSVGGTYGANRIIEAGVNLTGVLTPFLGGAPFPCFTTLIAEARSSAELTAQLKDYASGNFNTCLGSLAWEKRSTDEGNPLLGNATFSVTPDPATGVGGPVSVVDCVGAPCTGFDRDARPGGFLLENVVYDTDGTTYTVTESAAPAGYFADPTPRNATLDGDAPDQLMSDFLDAPHEAWIIVCKEVVNDNGGTAMASDFGFGVTGSHAAPASFAGVAPGGEGCGDGAGQAGTNVTVRPGAYNVSETSGATNYTLTASSAGCIGEIAVGETRVCVFTNDDDAPSLRLAKIVVNDDGGSANASAWTLTAAGPTGISGAGPLVASNASFDAGTYTLSETGPAGYAASGWSCAGAEEAQGTVTLALGQSATCTIVNDDIAPRLMLVKNVTNDNGGTLVPDDFDLAIDGNVVANGTWTDVMAGLHAASETPDAGYVASGWSGDCATNGSVTLDLAEDKICYLTNDDIAPSLTLVKIVDNDNGGTAAASDWTLNATGPTPLGGAGPNVTSDATFSAGTYTLAESGGPAGYSPGDWLCSGGAQQGAVVTLALAESATCAIHNDDDAPSLTLVKRVVNDNGGTMNASAWTLTASGPTTIGGAGPTVASNGSFAAGTYALNESGPTNYTASAWDCVGGSQNGSSITLALGEDAICTIVNDDNAPSLTLVKEVVNDNGGVMTPAAWTLTANGPTTLSGAGPSVASGATFSAGSYALGESGPTNYTASAWTCVGGAQTGASIALDLGESATCTIVNDDDAPSLTLLKEVVNDNGGSMVAADWTLTAAGPTGFSGAGPSVANGSSFDAGAYTLSESGPTNYTANAWTCVGGAQTGTSVALDLGESATCTIVNDDNAPRLTLVKNVTNDNGGTMTPAAWTLTATGPATFSGTGPTVASNASLLVGAYALSESGPTNYTASAWTCEGGSQTGASIALDLGESATCTIVNDDIAPSLTLAKNVTNDNGGTMTPANWTLAATGPTTLNGAGPSVASGATFSTGSYALNESGPSGYTASEWSCIGGSQTGASIALDLAETATCTIVNDDDPPSLTLIKTVVNDNGGTMNESAWTLNASGPTAFEGSGPSVASGATFSAGAYTLSESGPTNYTASAWTCEGGAQQGAVVTLGLGESAVCRIANDDDAPSLTLVKEVVNDNGGTMTPADWTLTAAGPTGFSGAGPSVPNGASFDSGTYVLNESGPTNYTASAWVCVGGSQTGASIALDLGESATCTISNDDNAPSLTLVKTVTNDNGGTMTPADWTLNATGPTEFGGAGPSVSNGASFDAGTYALSESGPTNYTASAWTCVGGSQTGASIVLDLGENATCTIDNDDRSPELTLVKIVTNDNGGTLAASDWTLTAAGPTGFSGAGPNVSNGSSFDAGDYDLSETGPTNYTAGSWICVGGEQSGASVRVDLGESATCAITNDDQAPSLLLVKQVVNDNGGTMTAADWVLNASGPTPLSGAGPLVASNGTFSAGAYTLAESGPTNYTASAWDCEGASLDGATLTLALGASAVCTIVNDDRAPSLTLVKRVTNDNGGVMTAADWTLDATGPTGFSGAGPSVANGVSFDAGTYSLNETGPTNYTASAWDCVGGSQTGSSITLALGENATCTITNDDDAPSLTLLKRVTNDNGGTMTPAEWTLDAAGPTGFSGAGPSVANGASFDAGTYVLNESGPANYTAGAWSCEGGAQAGANITLALGQSATCTIVNDDDAPSLTLVKTVTNDDGGVLAPSAWTLIASGPTPLSGAGPSVASGGAFSAGSYALAESGPTNYTASAWTCVGGSQTGASIALDLGESATCTIVNDDIAPTLTVTKVLVPAGSGTFDLLIDGTPRASSVGDGGTTGAVALDAGAHAVNETAGANTTLVDFISTIGGDCAADGTITLALAEDKTCTITNVKKALVRVQKTVLGAMPIIGQTFRFEVRTNASSVLSGSILFNASSDANGTVDFGQRLPPGSYQVCEAGLPLGWRTSLATMAGNFTAPDGAVCTAIELAPGEERTIAVDNTPPPGGAPRTIGYWKSWSSCSGGRQDPILDQTLASAGGIMIGDLRVDTCQEATSILDKSTLAGRKKADDAAYGLAAQLLAARLNVQNGATTCVALAVAIADGQSLLASSPPTGIDFVGTGDHLGSKVKGWSADLRAEALSLAKTLDLYNNGRLC